MDSENETTPRGRRGRKSTRMGEILIALGLVMSIAGLYLLLTSRSASSPTGASLDTGAKESPDVGIYSLDGTGDAEVEEASYNVYPIGNMSALSDYRHRRHGGGDEERVSRLAEPPPGYGVFDCKSSLDLGDVVMNENKGIALDDTTFQYCANEVPTHWPNTQVKVKTIRLFKSWGMTQPIKFRGDYHKAWQGLKGYAQAAGAKFLVGVSVTCIQADDEREWAAGREFIKYVGPEHIMGLAVGNEIDLQVGGGGCMGSLWRGGYLSIFKQRVREFDAIPGMSGLPVTAVLSMNSLVKGATWPFLKALHQTYGDRYKFSMNIYAQFSGGLAQAGCPGSIDIGTKFTTKHPAGFLPNSVVDIYRKLKSKGLGSMKIWVGELGWATHAYCRLCGTACSSRSVQQKFYSNFLKWDLEASDTPAGCGPPKGQCADSIHWVQTDGIYSHPEWFPNLNAESTAHDIQIHLAKQETAEARGGCNLPCDAPGASQLDSGPRVEHAFYFTMRDSSVFGKREEFGIMERCGDGRCKFR